MEAKDMATPEKGHRVFKATTALPRREIPIRSKPIPSQLEKPKKSWIKSKIARITLSVVAVVGLGYGVNEAYQNDFIPGVYHHIDVAPTFDNSQYSGAIGVNNTMEIDKNTLAKIPTTPAVPTPKHDVNLLLPIQDLPSDRAIAYEKTLIGGDVSPGLLSPQRKDAKEQDVKDQIILKNVPENTVILSPVNGQLEFLSVPKHDQAGTIGAIKFYYTSPEGPVYQIMLFGNSASLFKPLVDAKPYALEKNIDESKLRVPVKRGKPIAQTLQLADLTLSTFAWGSGEIGIEITETYPTNINFITLPDYLGQEKVVILGK